MLPRVIQNEVINLPNKYIVSVVPHTKCWAYFPIEFVYINGLNLGLCQEQSVPLNKTFQFDNYQKLPIYIYIQWITQLTDNNSTGSYPFVTLGNNRFLVI